MNQSKVMPSREGIAETAISEDSFQAFLDEREGDPNWLKEYRLANWKLYQETPSPNRTEENWRFGDPRRLSPGKCCISTEGILEGSKQRFQESSSILSSATARIILANNQCIEKAKLPTDLLDKGLVFESLESALVKHPERIQANLMDNELELGSSKQRALHAAFLENGTYLRIPSGVVTNEPLMIYHWLNGENTAIFPRTIIEAEENSEATVIEVYLSDKADSTGFACAMSSINASRNAKINRVVVQNLNLKTSSHLFDLNQSSRDAKIHSYSILLGSNTCRHETVLRLNEPGGEVRVRSLVAANGTQLFDQRSRQDHRAEHTTSDILCKNALLEESSSIFAGLIRVEENAQHTDAYQTNRNLVIGPSAKANALPGLEILANDVKCSHGATTGKIDEEQLFYLQSRGIHRAMAKQLVMLGFFEEVFHGMPSQLADSIRELLRDKCDSTVVRRNPINE
tara:strand:- start:1467 stop:2840 length:1374 start_codon:yes stop_codon:yes gene_type:complete